MVNHMRHTRGHTRNRRSHHALEGTGTILCEKCGMPAQKHRACGNCGFYKGVDALKLAKKADKKAVKKEKKASK